MKYLSILTLLVIISCCTSNKTNETYFEGVITYNVKTEIFEENESSDYLKEKYGTSMAFYWSSNGDLLRKTFGNKYGLDYSLFVRNENIFYNKYKGIDTLYFYKGSVIENELIELTETNADSILNQACKKIKIKAKNLISNKNYTIEYHYSGSPKINSNFYDKTNDGFINVLYKKSESPFLKLILQFKEFKMSYTAVNIENKEIENDMFIVDTTLPKKEY